MGSKRLYFKPKLTLKVKTIFELLFSFPHLKMMSIKTFVICACLVIQNTRANQPDVLVKRDGTQQQYNEEYYQAYNPSAAEVVQQQLQTFSEKQGSANAMENVFGDDAGLVLGTIGAIMGTLAAIGVVINNNNIHNLSKDQDNLCTTVKATGNTALTLSDASLTAQFTGGTGGTAATNTQIVARLNLIENAINAFTTPTC